MPKPKVSTTFAMVDKMTSPMRKMQKNVTRIAGAVGGVFITGKIAQGVKSFVTEASKIEDATAGFTPLMGGVQKATDLVGQLNKTAATTPFQFDSISKASKQLLPVMNQDINKTVKTFRMLGDTAGGNAQKLDSITRGYTKAMLKNKVDMESLNMIAEAGVPIYSELADSMGVSVQKMMKMSSAGKISSKDLTKAFEKMTSEGGVFYKGMEIASKTLTGKMSPLKDNINLTKAAIGESLLPTLKPLIDRAIEIAGKMREWVSANQDLINQKIADTIEKIKDVSSKLTKAWKNGLIPALIGFGTTMKVVSVAVTAWKSYKKAAEAATVAQYIMNAASKAFSKSNLIVLGISVAIAAIILLYKNWEKVSSFFKQYGDVILGVLSAVGTGVIALTIATKAFGVVASANPFVMIIAGAIALIAIIISVIKNWDKIKEKASSVFGSARDSVTGFAKSTWNWFNKILDNPFIAAASTILMPWVTIPALIVKNWEAVQDTLLSVFNKVKKPFEAVGKFFKGVFDANSDFNISQANGQANADVSNFGLIGKNDAIIQNSVNSTEWYGNLDITGVPSGSTFKYSGEHAPEVTLDTGFDGGRLSSVY
ncbi:MAG: tape measure protein [Spirochaetales bacterium]|nr:tape measure protein [Spirochaetales bacterium]